MVKILSQAGNSLADIYDAKGSVAGIEQLETRELPIVHEMGSTIFSERFSTFIRSISSGAIAQGTAWNAVITDLPNNAFRIFGIRIFISTTARVTLASLAIQQDDGREIPIWTWDDATDIELRARFSDDGAAAGTTQFLQPSPGNVMLPHMMAGNDQPQAIPNLAFRGLTSAFGAGTVTSVALIDIGFGQIGGISSRGLPLPSW